jgi:hypothetical protein
MHYKKLNFTLPELDLDQIKGDLSNRYEPNFCIYKIKNENYLNEILSKKISFGIQPRTCLIEVSDHISNPHIDGVDKVSLNYYLNTGGAITSFYKEKNETISPIGTVMSENLEGISFDIGVKDWRHEDLLMVDQFTAKNGDAYILDVDVIHDVTMPVGIRRYISWRWSVDYDTALRSIEILE